MTLQEIILTLQNYWSSRGCVIVQPWDVEKGAGTFNAATYLRTLGPEPWKVAYVEPSRRPADGRYGDNPNRLERHHQFQVILKPSPKDVQELYLGSLRALGIDPFEHDLRFVEDNWESPTLGAWGLGWEVWCDGMEVTQFTYFQQCGGYDLQPISVELTYGLERLAMSLQNVENVYDLRWNEQFSYGDIRHTDEVQWSIHNFEQADIALHLRWFDEYKSECLRLAQAGLPVPAYDYCLRCSHVFNILDARGAIGVTERQAYILRVRELAKACAEAWMALREKMGFPLTARALPEATPAGEPTLTLPSLPAVSVNDGAARGAFLLEIGVEEIPARLAPGAARQLHDLILADLNAAGLEPTGVFVDATPRRLVLAIDSLGLAESDREELVKGPPAHVAFGPDGAPTRAGEAFLAKLDPADTVYRELIGKVEYVMAKRLAAGRQTTFILSQSIPRALEKLHFPKSMRWGTEPQPFVRPIQWILCALAGRVVPLEFAGVKSGLSSQGHRFHAPERFRATTLPELLVGLEAGKVMLRSEERRASIVKQVEGLAATLGGRAVVDPGLVEEVTYLAEWPVGVLGHFEKELLDLPRQAIVTPMRVHQRYFPVENASGALLPGFVAIAGTDTKAVGVVAHGMARVLRARLADARFFFESDLKKPLDDYMPQLDTRIWLAKLGSVRQKVARITALVERLGGGATSLRAAALCKADLATQMVGEFPELQGEMGRVYATRHGEAPEVAEALYECYLPKSAGDALPVGVEGTLVGLADRFDSIVGCFGIGLEPTGSKDPYALRRQAIAVINVLTATTHPIPTDIGLWIDAAIATYVAAGAPVSPDCKTKIVEFFAERTRFLHRESLPADVVDAVVAVGATEPKRVLAKIEALSGLLKAGELEPILTTFRRVANITRGLAATTEAFPEAAPGDLALAAAFRQKASEIEAASQDGDFARVAARMAELRPVVDTFFDGVMVMADDLELRAQRVSLLCRLTALFRGLADFTAIQDRSTANRGKQATP